MGLRGVLSMSLEMCFSLTPRVYPEACSTPDVLLRLFTSLIDSVRAPSDEEHAGTVVLMLLKNLLTPANGPGVCGCHGLGMATCVCWQPALPAGGNARVEMPPCVLLDAGLAWAPAIRALRENAVYQHTIVQNCLDIISRDQFQW
jgi:hypothetical protein